MIQSHYFTRHALDVMYARGVTRDDVYRVIRDPHVTEPHQGRTRYVRDGLAVVVADDQDGRRPAVVTVLNRCTEQWTSEQMRAERSA